MEMYLVVIILSSVYAEETKHFTQTVLDAYIKYCGIMNTCNIDKSLNKYEDRFVGCQLCICNTHFCTRYNYCCPDIIMPHVSTEDLKIWNLKHFSIPVIDSCPENTNGTLKEMCSKTWSDITDAELYVVVDQRNTANYKNRYCAICNGIKEWTTPNFLMDCDNPGFPLNTYSTKEALLSGASAYGCRMQFKDLVNRVDIIDSCNVTGKWNKQDDDMAWACRFYATVPYSVFKNIFCYICNTGLSPRPPYIDNCISHDDTLLEDLCSNEQVDPMFYPYKNQYCKLCSILSPPTTLDFNVYMLNNRFGTPVSYRWNVAVYPNICYLRHLDIYSFLKISPILDKLCNKKVVNGEKRNLLQMEFDDKYQSSISNRSSRFINVTALFELYERSTGMTPWCNTSATNTTCSCQTNCFYEGDCCPDMTFFSKSDCIDFESHFPSIFAKCNPSNKDKILEYYCERKEDEYESLVDFVPLYHHKGRVHYKNIFCKICNEPEEDLSSPDIFWSVEVKCNDYIEVDNYLRNGKSYIELRDTCDVRLNPVRFTELVLNPAENQCPPNVNIEYSPSDVRYLCEWGGDFIYSTCKSKYKNVFCQMYNTYQENLNETFELSTLSFKSQICMETDDNTDVNYPFEFIFNPVDLNQTKKSKALVNCETDEFYDSKQSKCRTIKCSPGKLFSNGKCVPLLRNVSSLGYHTEMIATVINDAIDQADSVQDILAELLLKFSDVLNSIDYNWLFVSNITSIAYFPCESGWNEQKNTGNLYDIVLDIELETYDSFMVPRQELDELLLEMASNTYSIDVFGIKFQVSKSGRLHNGNLLKSNHEEHCLKRKRSFSPSGISHYFELDEFLVCPQIALEEELFQFVNSKELILKESGNDIRMPFVFGADDDVLVCLSNYNAIVSTASVPEFDHVFVAMHFFLLYNIYM